MSRENLKLEIDIPDGVDVEINGDIIRVKGEKGELQKKLDLGNIKIGKKDNRIELLSPSRRRMDRALLGTAKGDLENMIHGVRDGIEYKLKIFYSHFPMSVKIQGNKVVIENFLGEKHPRRSGILENVAVDVKGQDITVTGIDKGNVAQTAANLEQITKVKNLDPRVFQDGIYIVEKDGKKIS